MSLLQKTLFLQSRAALSACISLRFLGQLFLVVVQRLKDNRSVISRQKVGSSEKYSTPWWHRFRVCLVFSCANTTELDKAFVVELNKLKSRTLTHNPTPNLDSWISLLYSSNLIKANTSTCWISGYSFPTFRIFVVTDITDYITPLSVVSALKRAVQSDLLLQPEDVFSLTGALNTGRGNKDENNATESTSDAKDTGSESKSTTKSEVIWLVSSVLLSKVVALQFDEQHTLLLDAKRLIDSLSPYINISAENLDYLPQHVQSKSFPMLPLAVASLQMHATASATTISHIATSTTARLDSLISESSSAISQVKQCRSSIQEASGKMGYFTEEVFRSKLALEEGAASAERVKIAGLGELVRWVG